MISKDEFVQWRNDLVTKSFFSAIEEKIEDAKEILVRQAGIDSTEDAVLRGYARALYDILNIELEEVKE